MHPPLPGLTPKPWSPHARSPQDHQGLASLNRFLSDAQKVLVVPVSAPARHTCRHDCTALLRCSPPLHTTHALPLPCPLAAPALTVQLTRRPRAPGASPEVAAELLLFPGAGAGRLQVGAGLCQCFPSCNMLAPLAGRWLLHRCGRAPPLLQLGATWRGRRPLSGTSTGGSAWTAACSILGPFPLTDRSAAACWPPCTACCTFMARRHALHRPTVSVTPPPHCFFLPLRSPLCWTHQYRA